MAKVGTWEWWKNNEDTPSIRLAKSSEEKPLSSNPSVRALQDKLPERKPGNERNAEGYVYYCWDNNGRVKIGFSKNPWSRCKESQTWNPDMQLVAVERGNRQLEKQRHKQFWEDHLALEWFKRSDKLMKWMDGLKNENDKRRGL